MNSIVEQACNSVNGHSAPNTFNLIEQQAERIKELEAKCDYWRDHYKDLRQRIADAPIFGYTFSKHDNFGRVVWDVDHAVHPDAIEYRSLISKEDLL